MTEEINVSNPIQFEKILLKFLFKKESLRNKVLPFLKVELFNDNSDDIVKEIIAFSNDFGKFPSPRDLLLGTKDDRVKEKLTEIGNIVLADLDEGNLTKKVEQYFRTQLIFNEISQITIALEEGKLDEVDPQKLVEAKSFTFDDSIGLDIFEDDGTKFFEDLHNPETFIPTGFKKFDEMLCGGFKTKSLNLFIGGVNFGKTFFKCALSKQFLLQNQNVLFIPLEGTEEAIRDRIYYNLFDFTRKELMNLNLSDIKDLFIKVKDSIKNRLIIKEYPEHSFTANKLRLLLKELKDKRGYIPKVVMMDYMGLVSRNAIPKDGGKIDSNLKVASEEFHAVAKEFDIIMISSMQYNRKGFESSDPGMGDTSESFATMFTADEVFVLIQTDEMLKNSQYVYKKVKTRTGNKGFVGNIYANFEKQCLFELDQGQIHPNQIKKNNELIEKESTEILSILNKAEENKVNKNFEFT